MDYYILMEDSALKNPFTLQGYTIGHSKNFEDAVIQEKPQPAVKMVDYIKKIFLLESRHIVSDKIKGVLERYPEMNGVRALFVTMQDQQAPYWEIKCISVDCIKNKACKQLENILLEKEAIADHNIFSILFQQQEYLIFRFEAAEKIMQTFPLGIKFKPVKVEGGSI